MITRRTALLSLAPLLAAPLAAETQQAGKVYRVGYLSGISDTGAPHPSNAFRQSTRALG